MITHKAPHPISTVHYGTDLEGRTILQLTHPFIWRDPYHGEIIVNEGFIFDGGSSPSWSWSFLSLHPLSEGVIQAALIHDYLYSSKIVSRKEADDIFFAILKDQSIENHKSLVMWIAVRVFGGSAWDLCPPVEDRMKPVKVEKTCHASLDKKTHQKT